MHDPRPAPAVPSAVPPAAPVADAAAAPPVHLHLIAYNAATRAAIPEGWQVLDNQDNQRPDWFEYWPLRRWFAQQQAGTGGGGLDEQAFYGFFSPKFPSKTQLSHADVVAFVQSHAAQADVMLFSPQPDMGAFFLNVFEQGETFDAGLIDAYESLLAHIGRPAALRNLVMDSRQVVFSNYFVARPAFWREWLALNEPLFQVCEGLDASAPPGLREALCHPTTYHGPAGPAERKVFLQERVASLLLATQPRWRSVAYNPFGFGWSVSRLREHPTEAYISDALKMAWRDQRYPQYLQAFMTVRERFRNGTLEK